MIDILSIPAISNGKVVGGEGMAEEKAIDPWAAFGSYLRSQRQLARLSLRQLAELTRVSNPYLSQIERGLHQPSVAVIRALAEALGLSVEQVLAQAAGIRGSSPGEASTEVAIRSDPRLGESQKAALLAVYRSMVEPAPDADRVGNGPEGQPPPTGPRNRPSTPRSRKAPRADAP
jgi:transcriptional regulator with XRE-family HTH domain